MAYMRGHRLIHGRSCEQVRYKGGSGGGIGKLFSTGIIHVPGVNSGGIVGPNRDIKPPELLPPIDPKEKPELPTQNMEQIKNVKAMKALELARRSGKSSTTLTDQNKMGG